MILSIFGYFICWKYCQVSVFFEKSVSVAYYLITQFQHCKHMQGPKQFQAIIYSVQDEHFL